MNFNKPDRGSTKVPDHIMLSFCGDPKTCAAVSWRADACVTDGCVLLKDESGRERKIPAIRRVIESDIDTSSFFTAVLDGLTPGAEYSYTCGDENERKGSFRFKTLEENCEEFSFLVISDQQVGDPWEKPDYSRVNEMLRTALARHPEARFILTAGDNCDDGQNELQWNGMFSGLEGLIESVPFMMATGNHDNRGFKKYLPWPPEGKFYLDHADFFDDQFKYAYPQNGPEGFETENYSFDYANAHFCIMGVNEPELVSKWAEEDIKASDKTWKLGVYHFPIYPAIPVGQNDDGYPWLRPAVEALDLIFEGHEHTFARTYPMRGDAMFDRPSEGTVHYQCPNGSGGAGGNERKIWHTAFYTQDGDVPFYTLVTVRKNTLNAVTYSQDGRIADDFTIDKENDIILPRSLAPVYSRTRMIYKGSMPCICAMGTVCEEKGGEWFAPLAVLSQYIGAQVEKSEGCVKISMFENYAVFKEGSDTCETAKGEIALSRKVYRAGGQLMMPVSAFRQIFNIRCEYIKRNNILDFETEIEAPPVYVQL